MKKNKVTGILLIFVIIIFFCGYVQISNKQKAPDSIDSVLKAAIDMAYADFSLSTLRISGSEYVSITEKYLIDSDNYYSETVFCIDGVEYNVFDIKVLNEEEYTIFKESAIEMLKEFGFENIEELDNAYISNVIDDVNFSFKHVYTRITTELHGKEAYSFKKYTFSEKDDQWKIITINSYLDFVDDPKAPKTMKKYLVYDGKEIEYSNEIQLNQ